MDPNTFEPHSARALELQVGKAHVVIGLGQVDRIIETACTPMPMAHPLVRGIGFEARRPIVCVVLSGKATAPLPVTVTAVLLTGAGSASGSVTWALCADRVQGVVSLVGKSTAVDARLPRWIRRVRADDGRVLASIDPEMMIHDIGGAQ